MKNTKMVNRMKDAYWFSHDSNARFDKRMVRLRSKYDWYGYGVFWGVIEVLRDATEYRWEVDDIESLAVAVGVSVEYLTPFIEFCCSERVGLLKIENGAVLSTSLIRRMERKDVISEKRANARKNAGGGKSDNKPSTKDEQNDNKSGSNQDQIGDGYGYKAESKDEQNPGIREEKRREENTTTAREGVSLVIRSLIPSEEDVVVHAGIAGVDVEFARDWYALLLLSGWLDGDGKPIQVWHRYLGTCWLGKSLDWREQIAARRAHAAVDNQIRAPVAMRIHSRMTEGEEAYYAELVAADQAREVPV